MHVLGAREKGKALHSRSLSHDSPVEWGLGSSSLCSPFSARGEMPRAEEGLKNGSWS